MVSAREDANFLRLHLVHEPMFLGNPPGPASAEFVSKRLRLADARKRIVLHFSNQANHPKGLGAVLFDPPSEILEGSRIKFQASQ